MSLWNFLIFTCAVPAPLPEKKRKKKLTREDEERWREMFIEASSGNKSIYEELLNEMGDYLRGFCRRYVFVESNIDDCVQNCLMAIHKSRETYDPNRPFGPWFFAIVRFKIIDDIRARTRKSKHEFSHDFSEGNAPGSQESALANQETELLDSIDTEKSVRLFMSKLNDSQREVLHLTKIEGKTIKEAAKILKISESATKVRVHRASGALTKLIKDEFSKYA